MLELESFFITSVATSVPGLAECTVRRHVLACSARVTRPARMDYLDVTLVFVTFFSVFSGIGFFGIIIYIPAGSAFPARSV